MAPLEPKPAVITGDNLVRKRNALPEAKTVDAKGPISTPKSVQPRITDTKQLQGRWVGNDLTLTIQPDGKGRAELTMFSQGNGFFRITKDGSPVAVTADSVIDIGGSDPQFSFTIDIQPGQALSAVATPDLQQPKLKVRQGKIRSNYRFTILPGASADELVVREAAGKLNPNPMVLKRQIRNKNGEKPATAEKQHTRRLTNLQVRHAERVLTDFNHEIAPQEGFELIELFAEITCIDSKKRGFDFLQVELVAVKNHGDEVVPIRRIAMGISLSPKDKENNHYSIPTTWSVDKPAPIRLSRDGQSIDMWPRVTGDQQGPIKIVPTEPRITLGFVFSVPRHHELVELRLDDTVVPLTRRK